MTKCFKCSKELTEDMQEEGYETIFRCTCGALNSVREDHGLDQG